MIPKTLQHFFRASSFLLLFLTACARPDSIHLASDENEGGIIGTGIVGTITELGSIYVNGVRVIYDDDLKVETAFGKESPALLVPGDTVSIEAVNEGRIFKALSIERYRPIVAPIEAIAEDRRWVQALGIRVAIDESTKIGMRNDSRSLAVEDLPVGAWIAVSGLWRDEEVVASRIDLVSTRSLASVRGAFTETTDGTRRIGGVLIKNLRQSSIKINSIAAVQGIIERDHGQTELSIYRIATKRFSPKIRRVLIEGYVSPVGPNGAYTVYGSGLTSYTDDQSAAMRSHRSLFCGSLDGAFDIEQSMPWPSARESQKPAGDKADDRRFEKHAC